MVKMRELMSISETCVAVSSTFELIMAKLLVALASLRILRTLTFNFSRAYVLM